MSESYIKLIKTLQSLFEMDKADLDFGIYRVMNQKRDEINRFLEQDLLPQVRHAFADYAQNDQQGLQQELNKAIEQAASYGVADPENVPPVMAIKEKMHNSVDTVALENEVYSHLNTFFSRYYDKGDFISQRRYKKDTYAIPYEGEEVKLYWANQDQYYIKSSEHLRDYTFLAQAVDDKSVRIKLVEADIEKDNIKAKAGEERRFVLDSENPLSIENDELIIHFHYIPAGKKKQDKLNQEAVETIFGQTDYADWLTVLKTPAPTEKNPNRTLLEKHLMAYTARNTYDYFIHKDLGGFLRRELDFYIKNEVLFLDDIDDAAFNITEQHLRKIKVIRSIALKLIRMLAQLEDFQKKLWLKKKFVVATNYCLTLDRIDEHFHSDIVACDAQWQEWVSLGFITIEEAERTDIRTQLIKEQLSLIVDTQFFTRDWKDKLVASIDNLDEQSDGLLVHSENFQALNLLDSRFCEKGSNIFIDPPYNTGDDGFIYKDYYRSSTWLAMISERIIKGMNFVSNDGVFYISIGDEEQENLSSFIRQQFGKRRYFSTLIWEKKKKGSFLSGEIARMKDYVLCISKDSSVFSGLIGEIVTDEETYPCVNASNPRETRVIKPGILSKFREDDFILRKGEVISAGNMSLVLISDLVIKNRVLHKELIIEGNWRYSQESMDEYAERKELYITQDLYLRRIVKEPRFKRMKDILPRIGSLKEADFKAYDINDLNRFGWGTNEDANDELHQILGEQYAVSYPKPSKLLTLLLVASRHKKGYWIDYFSGSGTTGHAVINLNREDNGQRKYILVEMGYYFNTVLKPRIQKVIYSKDWKDGRPKPDQEGNLNGISHCFKYLKLESYEDTLNNLQLKAHSKSQRDLLNEHQPLREDYMLGYWLDVETKDSTSLLNLDHFEDPFSYQLNIATGSAGVTQPTQVDLVETFNYLLGLTVKHIDVVCGFKIVTGINPKEESVLVIWRNLKQQDNAALETFMDKPKRNPRNTEYDHIYINGDHTLDDPHCKVKMIEIEFKRLMFDVQGV